MSKKMTPGEAAKKAANEQNFTPSDEYWKAIAAAAIEASGYAAARNEAARLNAENERLRKRVAELELALRALMWPAEVARDGAEDAEPGSDDFIFYHTTDNDLMNARTLLEEDK